MRKTARRLSAAIAVLAIALAAALAITTPALAREYEITNVDIDATISADGTLSVVEERTFDFDGSFNGVYWDIPQGTGLHMGQDIVVTVGEVGEVKDGGFVAFNPGDEGSGVYEITEYYSTTNIKLYNKKSDEQATYRINYTIAGGLLAWDDCAELYWKFVSDGWDEPSQNVSCDVHLPVPAGTQVVAEDNVRAWAHGPLNGNVSITDDGAHFEVPRVGTSEFAEARITFPVEWVSVEQRQSGSRIDDIIAEETAWADEANARRERARRIIGTGGLVGLVAALGSVALGVFTRLRYQALHKAQFDDKYFRDVPTDDHPSVLGTLYNGGEPESKEFTAALMRLSDKGAVGLDLVSSGTGGGKQDYRITRNDAVADALHDEVDSETDYFLFRFLALRSAEDRNERSDTGFPPLMFKSIKKVAKKYPASYDEQYKEWQRQVTLECDQRGFFKEEGGVRAWPLYIAGGIDIAIAIAAFVFFIVVDAPVWLIIGTPAVLVAAAVGCFVAGAGMKKLSPEAVEIKARLDALRRWLTDFTRLEEAVPGDVVLWNRLLIMAVVLGVSDKVIKQLKMVKPELLSDPAFTPTYTWCVGHGSMSAPSKSMTKSVESAASVSMGELASSSSSSGGGGGGGFSGGGGGGFGGGGGGGAF